MVGVAVVMRALHSMTLWILAKVLSVKIDLRNGTRGVLLLFDNISNPNRYDRSVDFGGFCFFDC